MADPSPLLPPSRADLESRPHRKTLDDTIEQCIGPCGLWQSLQAVLISLAWAFDAQQTFLNVFTDAPTPWHCTSPDCSPTATRCLNTPSSWAWDRSPRSSIVSDWNLDCLSPALAGLPASAFFAGNLVGGLLLSTLADSLLGRKTMLFLSTLLMSLAAVATPLAASLPAYAALRFAAGFFRATIGTSSLVLSSEIVARRLRAHVAILGFFAFTLGFLSLPVIAFLCRDLSWRYLYLATAAPAVAYSLAAFLFLVESPRWLAVRGRRDEAIQTLKDMARSNGAHASVIFSSFSGVPEFSGAGDGMFSALRVLLGRRWSVERLGVVMTVGVGVGLLYYGMPLAVGDLGANLYWSVAINALAELPSSVVTSLLVERIDRRAAAAGFAWGSCGLSAVCVVASAGPVRMAAEVGAFFCACTAFNVVLIYGLELFPTCVRNSALAMVRQALVLGGVIAPVLVAAGRIVGGDGRLTFAVFSTAIGMCGTFALLLPETRGEVICDTMEEEEERRQRKAESDQGELA